MEACIPHGLVENFILLGDVWWKLYARIQICLLQLGESRRLKQCFLCYIVCSGGKKTPFQTHTNVRLKTNWDSVAYRSQRYLKKYLRGNTIDWKLWPDKLIRVISSLFYSYLYSGWHNFINSGFSKMSFCWSTVL